jgi:hypothetical protein
MASKAALAAKFTTLVVLQPSPPSQLTVCSAARGRAAAAPATIATAHGCGCGHREGAFLGGSAELSKDGGQWGVVGQRRGRRDGCS